jgi:hypothetical protein
MGVVKATVCYDANAFVTVIHHAVAHAVKELLEQ